MNQATPRENRNVAVQPQPRAGGRLTLEIRRDLLLGASDAAALDRLIEERPRPGIFVSPGWLTGFFAEPPAGFEPALMLLRDGDLLRGVMPVGVSRNRTETRIRLLGGGSGSDCTDLVAQRGFEAAGSDAVLSWAAETSGPRGFVFELRDVPADSALWGAIHRAGAETRQQLALQPSEIHTHPYLALSEPAREPDGEPWRAARCSIEKHRRKLERRCRLRIELLHDRNDVSAAFDALVRFLHRRWKDQGGSALDDPRVLRFHRRVLPSLLAEGRLRMIRLSADMRTIAVFYGIAAGSWWGYYLAGYDRDWAGRIHLGQITLASAIELAAREGATEFDFLKGADRVKYQWPVRERSTLDADLYSNRPGPQWRRAARTGRDSAAALVKSARQLLQRSAAPPPSPR
jgi:CelD/BcsL family acetyltransferase involved in cellulose biosynthesis